MHNHTLALDTDSMYHIYNRAAGYETLFSNEMQYCIFKSAEKYLLPNIDEEISKAISACCNAYTKWM